MQRFVTLLCLSVSWVIILKAAEAADYQWKDEETELQDVRTLNVNFLQKGK